MIRNTYIHTVGAICVVRQWKVASWPRKTTTHAIHQVLHNYWMACQWDAPFFGILYNYIILCVSGYARNIKFPVFVIVHCIWLSINYCLGNRWPYVLIDIYTGLGYTWDRIDTLGWTGRHVCTQLWLVMQYICHAHLWGHRVVSHCCSRYITLLMIIETISA